MGSAFSLIENLLSVNDDIEAHRKAVDDGLKRRAALIVQAEPLFERHNRIQHGSYVVEPVYDHRGRLSDIIARPLAMSHTIELAPALRPADEPDDEALTEAAAVAALETFDEDEETVPMGLHGYDPLGHRIENLPNLRTGRTRSQAAVETTGVIRVGPAS